MNAYKLPLLFRPRAFVLVVILAISSCYHSSEECEDTNVPLAITGIQSVALLQKVYADNEFELYDIVDQPEVVDLEDFQISVVATSIAAEQSRVVSSSVLDFFIEPAYASCPPQVMVSDDAVELIDIQSDTDLNGDYPAGTSLNSVLEINAVDSIESETPFHRTSLAVGTIYTPISEYVTSAPSAPLSFNLKFSEGDTTRKLALEDHVAYER